MIPAKIWNGLTRIRASKISLDFRDNLDPGSDVQFFFRNYTLELRSPTNDHAPFNRRVNFIIKTAQLYDTIAKYVAT